MSTPIFLAIGSSEAVEDLRSRIGANPNVTSSEPHAMIAYLEEIPESMKKFKIGFKNHIDPDLCPSFFVCSDYIAITGPHKTIMVSGMVDLAEDRDERVIKLVEWAGALFENVEWSDHGFPTDKSV